jgi:hypothetical protein
MSDPQESDSKGCDHQTDWLVQGPGTRGKRTATISSVPAYRAAEADVAAAIASSATAIA